MPVSRSNLNTLSLCDKVAISNSWGGFSSTCRDLCQAPCQTEYGLCTPTEDACRSICKLFSTCSKCPDCAGARDSCLNACQGTCRYDLRANLGLREVDGLTSANVTTLTPNFAARSFVAHLSIPGPAPLGLIVHAYADVSGVPTIYDAPILVNPLKAVADFSYSCPSSGKLVLHLDQLTLSPVDPDFIFVYFRSLAENIPWPVGLGDAFKSWLNNWQQQLTREYLPTSAATGCQTTYDFQ